MRCIQRWSIHFFHLNVSRSIFSLLLSLSLSLSSFPSFFSRFNLVRIFEVLPLELNDIRSVLDSKQERESCLKRGQQLMRLDLECNGPKLKLLFDNEKLPGRRLCNRLISSMKESYLCGKAREFDSFVNGLTVFVNNECWISKRDYSLLHPILARCWLIKIYRNAEWFIKDELQEERGFELCSNRIGIMFS